MSGWMLEIAPKLKAMVVFGEHRCVAGLQSGQRELLMRRGRGEARSRTAGGEQRAAAAAAGEQAETRRFANLVAMKLNQPRLSGGGSCRYYGSSWENGSWPYGPASFDGPNVSYLTVEQALADYADLIRGTKRRRPH